MIPKTSLPVLYSCRLYSAHPVLFQLLSPGGYAQLVGYVCVDHLT